MSAISLKIFFKFFSRALMLLLVMPVTNCARGLVAKWQGDDTADRQGRITLDPFSHLDPLGSLAILLCGFGWSKPMPIVYSRMNKLRRGIILVSLAGPVSHFLSAIFCYLIEVLMIGVPAVYTSIYSGNINAVYCVYIILDTLASINVCLGVINLLPLCGMDGFNILYQLSGPKFHNWYHDNYRAANQGSLIILLILFFIPDITGGAINPIGWLAGIVESLLFATVSWIPNVIGG